MKRHSPRLALRKSQAKNVIHIGEGTQRFGPSILCEKKTLFCEVGSLFISSFVVYKSFLFCDLIAKFEYQVVKHIHVDCCFGFALFGFVWFFGVFSKRKSRELSEDNARVVKAPSQSCSFFFFFFF